MVILPTLGRPKLLQRFIEAYTATKATVGVHIVLDVSDRCFEEYHKIEYPESFSMSSVMPGVQLTDIQNRALYQFPSAPFYGFMADDCVPETEHWDTILAQACLPDKISWGDDGIQGGSMVTHFFIGGDLARKIGWVAAPGFRRFYTDNVLTDIARGLGRAVYMPGIKLTHYHHMNGKAGMDETYRRAPPIESDGYAYEMFLRNDLAPLLERLRA